MNVDRNRHYADEKSRCPSGLGSEAKDRGFISHISYAKLPRFEIYNKLYGVGKHSEETCPVGACGVIQWCA